jgi:abortive infection bacteriophage resistance protein
LKQSLTYDQQLDYLEQIKGLTVGDREAARDALMRIGYFSLIGGYKDAFKEMATGKFISGTTFEDIVATYDFDETLRELFLKYILRVERNIRSLLSYHFVESFGINQSRYLSKSSFSAKPYYANGIAILLKTLNGLANTNTDYAYIVHHRVQHGNVPIWALVNALTFGTLSKFLLFVTQSVQTKVAKHFDSVNRLQLNRFLSVLTKFRNCCSHNERLIGYTTRKDISDMPLHKKLGINKTGSQYQFGKHDLLAVVIAFRYLLPNEDFKAFKSNLVRTVNKYLKSTTAMSEDAMNAMLGFPANWRSITRYKK